MRVTIIGLGLIGGSLGAALRRAGYHVTGLDVSPRHARVAQSRELVDDAAADLTAAIADAEMVILATPVKRIVELLPRVDALCPPETVILDTGSVKRPVIGVMEMLPDAERLVGGHPLAGKEISGPEGADSDLFIGRPFFLAASNRTAAGALERATELARAVGAIPIVVDATEHDEILASTSHLPQILSTVLAAATEADPKFMGSGFQDMTRLAGADSALWRDILLGNADFVVSAGRRYVTALDRLLYAIESGDVATIESTLDRGRFHRVEAVGAGP